MVESGVPALPASRVGVGVDAMVVYFAGKREGRICGGTKLNNGLSIRDEYEN